MCVLNPSMYERVKRNKTLKNPQKKVCNDSFRNFCRPLNTWTSSNFVPFIKFFSSYCIYLIQQSPQFTSAAWSNTSWKHCINFKYAKHANFLKHNKHANFLKQVKHAYFLKHAISWGMPSTPSTRACKAPEARKAREPTSTANTWARQARKARKTRKHAI